MSSDDTSSLARLRGQPLRRAAIPVKNAFMPGLSREDRDALASSIARRVRELRDARGLSQRELGDESGLGHRAIRTIEAPNPAAPDGPGLYRVATLARFFGVSIGYLCGEEQSLRMPLGFAGVDTEAVKQIEEANYREDVVGLRYDGLLIGWRIPEHHRVVTLVEFDDLVRRLEQRVRRLRREDDQGGPDAGNTAAPD